MSRGGVSGSPGPGLHPGPRLQPRPQVRHPPVEADGAGDEGQDPAAGPEADPDALVLTSTHNIINAERSLI